MGILTRNRIAALVGLAVALCGGCATTLPQAPPVSQDGRREPQRLNIFDVADPLLAQQALPEPPGTGTPDSPSRDIDVVVSDVPTGSFMVGVGIKSDAGLMGSRVLSEGHPEWVEECFWWNRYPGLGGRAQR
jgi:hypothetical protein